jgi:hypothetical protein
MDRTNHDVGRLVHGHVSCANCAHSTLAIRDRVCILNMVVILGDPQKQAQSCIQYDPE